MTKDWTAPELLETTGSYWQGCTIMAGVNLDVFNLLDAEPANTITLAERIDADPRALGMLLRALEALGFLEQEKEKYSCTLSSKQLLVANSPSDMGNIISHQHHLVNAWAQLDQAVKSGKPQHQQSSFSEDEWRDSFLLGMQNLANLIAPQLVPLIDIGDRHNMLDLGGGPGTWSIHFCQHNPTLTATVFDLPDSRNLA